MIIPVTSSPKSGVSQPIPLWRSLFLRPELLSSLSWPTQSGGADSITSPGSSSRSSTSPSCDTLLAPSTTTMPPIPHSLSHDAPLLSVYFFSGLACVLSLSAYKVRDAMAHSKHSRTGPFSRMGFDLDNLAHACPKLIFHTIWSKLPLILHGFFFFLVATIEAQASRSIFWGSLKNGRAENFFEDVI